MGLPIEEVRRIKKQFEKEYYFKEPYSRYVNMCGISRVDLQEDENAPEDEKQDLCIMVGLRKRLPKKLALPATYKGVRVYVKVYGEIVAQ